MMKKLLFMSLLVTSCAVNPLKDVDTYGLTYDGTNVYFNDEVCAELSAVEVAYDDGKIVREATFVLVDSKYNDRALSIIKLVKEKQPSLEVEVELKK
jgi:major membrane immunogen (membrane-anchored lipoprotein)